MTEFYRKKINLDEKTIMIYNKYQKPIYKTEKGYKSDKLDNLFFNFGKGSINKALLIRKIFEILE